MQTSDLSTTDLAISACAGGFLSSLLTTPLDVVKTRHQAAASLASGPNPLSRAVLIARHEGVAALWSGLRPAFAITIPSTVIYMSAYERIKDSLATTSLAPWAPLLSGGLSRTISGVVTAPLELIRTRAQATSSPLKGGLHGAMTTTLLLARREGAPALWRGTSASLSRDVPFSMLYWCLYESLKSHATRHVEPTPTVSMAAASVAAGLAAIPTTPLDVAKTRMQVLETPPSLAQVLQQLYRHEGLAGLFAGAVPRVTKVAPSCAIIVGAYELGKVQLASVRRS